MASIQYRLFSRGISVIPLKLRMKILFFRRFGYLLSFNNVTTFNEKLQFYKVFCRDPLLTTAADKISAKELVSSIEPRIYIPNTIKEFSNSEELLDFDFSSLPKNYVIKANHTSQTIIIVKGGNHPPVSKLVQITGSWLRKDQSTVLGEWAYKNITRKIFIEEYLDFEGKEPDDYKFFVFNGKVHFIQVDYDRFSNHTRNIYSKDWELQRFEYSHPNKSPTPQKPSYINEMIEVAEKIGEKFSFIRVDLYFYKNRVTFGELTNYPGAGFEKFPSLDIDKKFGEYWSGDW